VEYYENPHNDTGFYNKLDQEIYKFVDEVKNSLSSVSKELNILGIFNYLFI